MEAARLLPAAAVQAMAKAVPELAASLPHGLRVGESTALSTSVHLVHPADPDSASVLVGSDAGQVFYGRARPGEIVHLDIFHAPGRVPPGRIAQAFALALEAYRDFGTPVPVSAALFDVQTAVGGGRLNGALQGGTGAAVRAAHRGHVHLAGRLSAAALPFCFLLVAAVERALVGLGLPPRRLRHLWAVPWDRAAPLPGLEQYAALGDSLLREPEPMPKSLTEADLMLAAEVAEQLGGAGRARQLLQALESPTTVGALAALPWSMPAVRGALAYLVQRGLAEPSGSLWQLTAQGQRIRRALALQLREVELWMRRSVRRLPGGLAADHWPLAAAGGCVARRAARWTAPPVPGLPWWEVAIPESLAAAARRPLPLRVRPADLRVRHRRRRRRIDLCLLIDASASMEGARIRAARLLARHLLLTGRGRVAVITFQERQARVAVPLTRNYAAAERGLEAIVPAGLTPLGAGLRQARRYLEGAGRRRVLLLLVTDGIPTAAEGEKSPLEEAMAEAAGLRGTGLSFCCIGLEPNEQYLRQLVAQAGGRLYTVAELQAEVLARLARRERAWAEAARGPRRGGPTGSAASTPV